LHAHRATPLRGLTRARPAFLPAPCSRASPRPPSRPPSPLPPPSRATFYGSDGWSIHSGSCGYGQLAEDVGTGWDVAALADGAYDYQGSCGKCKEVRCKPTGFKDGYGAYLDRSSICYDTSASVVVMITDTCPVRPACRQRRARASDARAARPLLPNPPARAPPLTRPLPPLPLPAPQCHYPGNYASNKRWCCGDMYHMDLSLWAFEKLADAKWGVMALEWRDVSCSHRPSKPAQKPWGGRTPMPENYKPRPGWNRWMDKRIAFLGNGGRRMKL
jgi:hypothetical protein